MATTTDECDCCGFVTALDEYPQGVGAISPGEMMRLCGLCANTHAARGVQFRHGRGDAHDVMKAICYVGNAIIAAIKASDVSR